MRLIQFETAQGQRQVGVVEGDAIQTVRGVRSTRELALAALRGGRGLVEEVLARGCDSGPSYRELLEAGRVLPPLDHEDPAHCLISGTGLTHLGSASTRDKMHQQKAQDEATMTDTLRMFKWGVEGGKPLEGAVGAQPEWFYKGDGQILVDPGQDFTMPAFAEDGGEEPEVAGIYLIDADGTPVRLGFAIGNEFSDHITERGNYLWLAHSKLRQASLGPELLLGDLPQDLRGTSRIVRNGETVWEKPFLSGETNMSHTIANLEHHHFKYGLFRRPGDIHVHFFGTATLSFSDGFATQEGDVFEVEAKPFTLPVRNGLTRAADEGKTKVKAL